MVNWKKFVKLIPHRVIFSRKGEYEICYIDDFKDLSTLGETRYDPKQIVIKTKQAPRMTIHTYIHECLHAISHEYSADLTEAQVLALEKAVYYILKKNNIFKE